MKNIKQWLVLLIVTITICTSCTQHTPSNEAVADQAAQMLGTIITATAYGNNASNALTLAFDRVKEIENKMSRTIRSSEISLINETAGKKPVTISPDTYFVIETALHYANTTNGIFNPVLGKIIDLWGIGTDHAKIPSPEELDKLLPYIDYHQLQLNKEEQSAMLNSPLLSLDLGGIAKGYAADEMKTILLHKGITSACLNLGGNVLVIGTKPNGSLWTIGIQHPLESEKGELAATIQVKDRSVVTSGNYQRYFEAGGKKYHHIINPSTGYPADSGIISATIIAPSSIDADAFSTSVYILGKDKGLALIESLPNIEAIIITDDLHIYTTSGIDENIFKVKSKEFVYEKSR